VGVVGHDPPLLDIGGWALRRLRQLPVDGELRYDCSRSGPFLEFARHKDRVRITSSTSQVSVHVDYTALLGAWEAFAAQVRGFLAPFDGGAALLEDADYVPSVAPRSLYVIPESSPYIRFELDGPSTLVHYSSTDSVGEIGFDQLHSAWTTFAEDVRRSLLERIPALASHPDWPR
jgi:hypothetical protein